MMMLLLLYACSFSTPSTPDKHCRSALKLPSYILSIRATPTLPPPPRIGMRFTTAFASVTQRLSLLPPSPTGTSLTARCQTKRCVLLS
jgi:hypothetical protein